MDNSVNTIPGRNGGTLRKGGTNKGGLGRLPNELRARAGQGFEKALELAHAKLDKDGLNLSVDQLGRVLDVCGKYSIGTKSEVSVTNLDALKIISSVTSRYLDADTFALWVADCTEAIKTLDGTAS